MTEQEEFLCRVDPAVLAAIACHLRKDAMEITKEDVRANYDEGERLVEVRRAQETRRDAARARRVGLC